MTPLKLGADTVAHLIPHRRPFVFLDGIEAYAREPRPTLVGHKHVSVNEPVFDGHFPGLSLWPGVYTVEGMGQAVNALLVLQSIIDEAERRGFDMTQVLDTLRAIDRRMRLGKRAPTEMETELLTHLGEPRHRVGLVGAMDIKLDAPVFAGCELTYHVTRTRMMESTHRFDVNASVGDVRVARGTMTSTVPGSVSG